MGDNTTAALIGAFQFHKGTIRTFEPFVLDELSNCISIP